MDGSNSSCKIPSIEFRDGWEELVRGTQGWNDICKRVRRACEDYGCFEVVYDHVSLQLRADSFSFIKQTFSLPLEIRKKNIDPKPYHGWAGLYPQAPLFESFGIEDASNFDSVKNFAQLMWPLRSNEAFCQNISSLVKSLEELHQKIGMMILDSYGLGKSYGTIVPCKTLFRIMKYDAPPNGEAKEGLNGHTDKPLCTILGEEQVSGLEIQTKDGKWIKWSPSPASFIFIVGDPLMAWSNGRLHSVKHRVTMKGDKDRYSLGVFLFPIEGTIIKTPKELIDEEHPQIFKEFEIMDFMRYSFSKEGLAGAPPIMKFALHGNS